ncbi:MAG: S1C family serine protease [Halanaeroarchaeum sp.]
MARRAVRLAVVFLALGLVVGGVAGGVIGAASVTPGPAIAAPGGGGSGGQAAQNGAVQTAGGPSYAALYRQTIDSVVKITVTTSTGRSQGSGFVYDSSHIVTNHHVVGSADNATVQFADGSYRTAQVVGSDVDSDLAVLSVSAMPAGADPLPVATRQPQPGDLVVAMGTPFGLEGTITHGIVSGVNRSMTVQGGFSIPDTVQTDAPINPGNSGGPLISTDGTVVGVNRAKEGDNVGFAISAAVVRRVVPELIHRGTYHHSFVGVRTVPVTPEVADVNGMDRANGLMVVGTFQGGPAAGVLHAANVTTVDGVQYPVDGDVIVAIDGHEIQSSQTLSSYLLLHTHPGDTVTLTLLRKGTTRTVEITLARRPSS